MFHIAIMGLGVVGGGLWEAVTKNQEEIKAVLGQGLHIKYVLDKRSFPGHELEKRVVNDIQVILQDTEISVVAETMGGERPAYDFTLACLNAGKSVVTSNKLVVEKHGKALSEAAARMGVSYLYEASVGGGIPVMHPIYHCLSGNRISRVVGILNGTTNYILGKMETENAAFADALADAQAFGYAEADPSADIEGHDTARKICILATAAFGGRHTLEDMAEITGITAITPNHMREAREKGYKIKLLGMAERTADNRVSLFAKPCLVPSESLLFSVDGVYNCIEVTGNLVGKVAFYGHGAGGLATASAVLSDIIEALTIKTPPVLQEGVLETNKQISHEKSLCIAGENFPVIG